MIPDIFLRAVKIKMAGDEIVSPHTAAMLIHFAGQGRAVR